MKKITLELTENQVNQLIRALNIRIELDEAERQDGTWSVQEAADLRVLNNLKTKLIEA